MRAFAKGGRRLLSRSVGSGDVEARAECLQAAAAAELRGGSGADFHMRAWFGGARAAVARHPASALIPQGHSSNRIAHPSCRTSASRLSASESSAGSTACMRCASWPREATRGSNHGPGIDAAATRPSISLPRGSCRQQLVLDAFFLEGLGYVQSSQVDGALLCGRFSTPCARASVIVMACLIFGGRRPRRLQNPPDDFVASANRSNWPIGSGMPKR